MVSNFENGQLFNLGQPRVSQWLESSDFSSIPDLEHFGEPAAIMTEEDMCRPSTSQLPVVRSHYMVKAVI